MPELPDVLLYVKSLNDLLCGKQFTGVSLKSPFLLRSFEFDLFECEGKSIVGFERLGKRILWKLDNDWILVFHLMIAGRFHWKKKRTLPKSKVDLAAFHFEHGTMMLTEASTKKRASLHIVENERGLEAHRRTGIDVLSCDYDQFKATLTESNHTLKRALTNPSKFDGIGNAYSDEILFHAKLSPIKWTSRLSEEEIERLFESTQNCLASWIELLQTQSEGKFPEKVTAFRPEMMVHGKFKEPCTVCGKPIQRIVFAENELNYCAVCQNDGKILADRSLSRLLKDDWPRTIEEWEQQ